MSNIRMAGVLAAGAMAALIAAAPAHAQMMVPVPPGGLTVDTYSDAPKADPGDNPANWSARRNVTDSDRYERLLKTNPAFRAARIRKECGEAEESGAYQQCVATFR